MVCKDGSRFELDLEKVDDVGGLGIAKNDSVSCDIICKLLMPGSNR